MLGKKKHKKCEKCEKIQSWKPRCVKQNKILKWKIFALTCIESTKNQELSKMHIQK
jgi:hypothetical protein